MFKWNSSFILNKSIKFINDFITVVYVQLLQNESPYIIAVVIKNVGIRNNYKGKM
jgi:hypothetical protein